jgi:hypothetical protein
LRAKWQTKRAATTYLILTKKANGIKYLYASLDKHPNKCMGVTKAWIVGFEGAHETGS